MTPLFETATILIIDDTPSNLSVVVNMCEDKGYRVAIAQDAEEGMQRARLVKPDLILLDVMMPGMDGFEACKHLKADPVTRDTPVVFMTALASAEHKIKGFRAGAVDYVTKPLQIDEVMARVETHLQLHAAQKRLAEQNEELERRVAERTAELTAREREFRTLAENLPDNLARYDKQCRLIYMNSRLEKLLGRPRSEWMDKTPLETVPGEMYVVYQAMLQATMQTGQPGEMELVIPGGGDALQFHHIRFVAERDEWGEIIGALAIGSDITERKRAERELSLLNRAVNNSTEAIFLMDAQGRFVYVNETACNSLGYSREALLTMRPTDIDPDITHEMLQGLMAYEPADAMSKTPFETRHRTRDGRTFPVEIVPSPIILDGERYFLSMARDISERKLAEQALRESNQRYRLVFENSPISIWEEDFSAVRKYFDALRDSGVTDIDAYFAQHPEAVGKCADMARIVDVNQAAVELHEAQSKQALITGLFNTFTPESLEAFRQELCGLWQGRTRMALDAAVKTMTGALRNVTVHFSVCPGYEESLEKVLVSIVDITERKLAEDAVRASEEKYRTLIRKIRAAVVVHGADTQVLTSNPVAQEILGLTEEQLQGKVAFDPAWHFFREDGSPLSQEEYPVNKVLASGKPISNYVAGIHRPHQAEDVWVLVNADPVFGQDGAIEQVIVTFADITQLKHAEAALAVREREFRTLAENIPDTIIRYDVQARKTYVNTSVSSFIGVSSDSLIGRTPEETLPARKADQADAYMRNLRQTLTSGEPRESEVELHHAQQGTRVLNIRFVAERDEQGKIVGALMVGRDITAMKAIENELKEREQRYREIFENAVEGIYLLEVTEDGRFRNIDINPALAASTGMPREEMIGQYVDDTVPEEVGREIVEKYRRCVAAGTTITESLALDLPAGKRHYISTITPITYQGRIHRLIGISRDITELKKAEHELEESRIQLRGLTARREAVREEERKYIAREVHDELGQILTGLKMNVSLLEHRFAGSSPELRDCLKETAQLTDRSLEVARNVASALRPASLDMGIASALEWLAERFSANTGIECSMEIDEGGFDLSESFAIALFRIAQESLTNIARHAQASHIEITLCRGQDDYVLKVRDNGTGFDVNRKKTGSFGVVGMRERALMLGGELVMESQPGKGTQVMVRIPRKEIEGEL